MVDVQRGMRPPDGLLERHRWSESLPAWNDPSIANRVKQVAQSLLPESHIAEHYRSMVSEDMAFIMQDIPGCYVFVGSANPDRGLDASHHHPRFDFDEEILPYAVALVAAATVRCLEG